MESAQATLRSSPIVDAGRLPVGPRMKTAGGASKRDMARPLLVLHIGSGKCGSSAIQQALRLNRGALADLGVLVPDSTLRPEGVLDETGHLLYLERLRTNPKATEELRTRWQGCREAMLAKGLHTLIVSSESLLLHGEGLMGALASAGESFDVRAVAYIRRQDDFLLASWKQWWVKVEPDFSAWLDRVTGTLGDWESALARWEAASFVDELVVRTFERARLIGGDVVPDFFQAAGIRVGPALRGTEVNRSVSDVVAGIAARNQHLFHGVHDHRFYSWIGRLGGPLAKEAGPASGLLGEADRRRILDRYRGSNESVARKYFGGRSPLFDESIRLVDGPPDDLARLRSELDLLWTILFRMSPEAGKATWGTCLSGTPSSSRPEP